MKKLLSLMFLAVCVAIMLPVAAFASGFEADGNEVVSLAVLRGRVAISSPSPRPQKFQMLFSNPRRRAL